MYMVGLNNWNEVMNTKRVLLVYTYDAEAYEDGDKEST